MSAALEVAYGVENPIRLDRAYVARYGVPRLMEVDRRMFTRRYFTHCLACTFCHDWCCADGVDVDLVHVRAMERHRGGLEAATGIPFAQWFTDEIEHDDEVPGGATRRTNVTERGCIFLVPEGRGCMIHRYCHDQGLEYHELKSLVDVLFPLTFDDGLLTIADEVVDGSLVCLDTGPTIYRGMRKELRYYFGEEFVLELDRHEAQVGGERSPMTAAVETPNAVAEVAAPMVRESSLLEALGAPAAPDQ